MQNHSKTSTESIRTLRVRIKDKHAKDLKSMAFDVNHALLKHGPLKNMKLPAMTMLFKVQDEKTMKGLKVGDDILFIAEGNMRIIYLENKK